MSKRRSALRLSCLLLAALNSPTIAQSSACADQLSAGVPCCGQYECVEDRPLSLTEVQVSRSYPQFTRQEPELIDPAPRIAGVVSVEESREARSTLPTGEGRHD